MMVHVTHGGAVESAEAPSPDDRSGHGSESGKTPKGLNRLWRYLSDKNESGESGSWRAFRAIRWILAVVVVILAARASREDVCHVTTTIRTGLATFSGLSRTEHVTACVAPGFDDLLSYFAIIAVLLLPDARSIAIGGFQFERLTSRVEQVARDVGDLKQTVNTTINLGMSLSNELRSEFKRDRKRLDELRRFLPDDDDGIANQLARIEEFDSDLDSATVGAFLKITVVMQDLLDAGQRGLGKYLAAQAAAGDEDSQVVPAAAALSEILGTDV